MLRSRLSRRTLSNLLSRPSQRSLLQQAFARGPSEPPLLEQTVGQHFASIVSAYGDRTAIISRHQQTRLSYDVLDKDSNKAAGGLINLGVRKGDRVAVSLGNSTEFATLTYALFKIGAIMVPLNPAFSSGQVISALNHLAATHLIIGAETNLPRRDALSNLPLLREISPNVHGKSFVSERVPSLKHLVVVDNSKGRLDVSSLQSVRMYTSIIEDGSGGTLQDMHLSPDDIVNIQFTSGTTSMPKAACLSHRSILNNGNSIGDRMLLTPSDIVCCPPPLYHCFGCILGYMATATHGSSIVFPSEAFSARAALLAVQEYQCTALYGVPSMFLSELSLIDSGAIPHEGFQHLRTGIAAGSSVPAEVMRKLHRTLNLTELTICYGMTETSPVSCMTTTDDPLEKRIDSVGRLLPHVSAKVVDPAGQIVDVGQKGELAVSGYLVMKGYWGDKVKTDEVMIADEKGQIWMHTGDEAVMDEEGYVKITGRMKDIIIRGGENIHPLDVENCLLAHDKVEEISAYAVPDAHYGEVVAVSIVAKSGLVGKDEEVRAWVREKLSGHFVPKHIFWTDNFPKTASGKIQRFKLQEEAVQKLGLNKPQ